MFNNHLARRKLLATRKPAQNLFNPQRWSMGNMHSSVKDISFGKMTVKVMPALKDNYMYLLIDKESHEAAAIDPVNASFALEQAQKSWANITQILTTHHHWDHASGNEKLLKLLGRSVNVYGGDSRIAGLTNKVKDNDQLRVGSLNVKVLYTPCHTSGHVCYLVTTNEANILFSGDAIFQGGCGRFFEGTADQAYCSLCEKISSLPDDTKIFCGHEYTVQNLKFAKQVEPLNKAIKDRLTWAEAQRAKNEPTVPSTIGQEKQFNPFMRVREPQIHQFIGVTDPIEAMKKLRLERNSFVPT